MSKQVRVTIIGALGLAVFCGYAFGAANPQVPTSQPSAATPSTMPANTVARPDAFSGANPSAARAFAVDAVVNQIQSAIDPSTVIEAYARGVALDSTNTLIQQAYMRRMVELGQPDLAASQAQKVVLQDPTSGVAWAVIGSAAYRHGDAPGATSAVLSAVKNSPNDPFVLKTAGQVIGWYKTLSDHGSIDATVQQAIANVDLQLGKRPDYTNAYNKMTTPNRRVAAGPTVTGERYAAALPPVPQMRTVQQPIYPVVIPQGYQPQNLPPVTVGITPGMSSLFDFGRPQVIAVTGATTVVRSSGGGE